MPKIVVFETRERASHAEKALKDRFVQKHCYRGLAGSDRREIAEGIAKSFKNTSHYLALRDHDKIEFERFLRDVYFTKRTHPENPRRTFYWGDCLEPKFLKTIGVGELEPVVERVLRVQFYE